MLGNLARMFVLAGVISGLCSPVLANTTTGVAAASVASVLGIQDQRSPIDRMQLAQTDLALPDAMHAPIDEPIVEAIEIPVVTTRLPPVRIALLLPTRAESLARVAEAVRAGFMAAYQHEPGNITVNLVETGDAAQDILSGYLDAVSKNDIVVGPLTRSGAAAIVQNNSASKPTIVLTQLNAADDAEVRVPSNMLVMGLSIEDEARQVANWAGAKRSRLKAFAISTNVSWQKRAVKAFAAQWSHLGLQSEVMELGMTGGFINANTLVQLKKRIQAEKPGLIFVGLDAAQAIQLRLGIGGEVTMYGTSQLNPFALKDWTDADRLTDLEGVRLLDMPWQLQADHAAVMTYPHLAKNNEQRISPDIERLYALGIDAYRVAANVAIKQTDFDIDGVTGKLTVRFGRGAPYFERVLQPAIYREGMVQPLEVQ
ncbi:penicillin-binding protein activator [Herminiimonas arsenitoxidans]|uniref:penicillin-binding protein activator n=1 Tax=Herminiimonas arsenitoxidans TaxID=1809410 RepID=UPI000970D385|nr:penicillin-binding protein activator [Herminiimonas arsenitoxidans]